MIAYLSILVETMDTELGEVIRKRGGYDHIVFGGEAEKEIRMNIVASVDSKEFAYEMSFWKYEITGEKLFWKDIQISKIL